MIETAVFVAIILLQYVQYISITFRLAYWRAKAVIRMSKNDRDVAKKSKIDSFWSFMK